MLQEIFNHVDLHFNEMVNDLKEVCTFRSVAGDTNGLESTRKYLIKSGNLLDYLQNGFLSTKEMICYMLKILGKGKKQFSFIITMMWLKKDR